MSFQLDDPIKAPVVPELPEVRVLIVDDNPQILEDFRQILTGSDSSITEGAFEVMLGSSSRSEAPPVQLEVALSGRQGIELVNAAVEEGRPFSMAFVDATLEEGLNGLQVISRMWEHDPRIEMVLVSGRIDLGWGEMISSLGQADRLLVLKKPFDVVEVRQLAYALCEKRRLRDEIDAHMRSLERTIATRTEELRAVNSELEREMQNRVRTESELRDAQKLEAVGQLASGIAHEINTPIQFIGDSVEFVREAFEDMFALVDEYRAELRAVAAGEKQPDLQALAQREDELDLEFIREELPQSIARTAGGVERVAEIVRGMKGFAHQDTNEMQTTDLNATIRDTLIVARNEYKYVADVETEFGELPPVECFAGQLSQVLLNLVVNAAHAIADNTPSGQRGKVFVTSRCVGDLVEIEVRDTGGGIPERVRHRIFEPFFTTKEVGKGTGQGLAIVHRIITECHAGTVKVEVEDGVGTTFKIQIPAVRNMECAA